MNCNNLNEFNNYSIMSYSFHGLKNVGAMDIFGYLETVRYRYNLRTADIWNGLITSYDDDYIKLVKEHIDERGLSVVNFCCDGAHIWCDDLQEREENEKMAWNCLKFAKAIGAKTIRIDAGVREEFFTEEQMRYVAAKYEEYCKYAAEFGASVGTENHWGATTNPKDLNWLFESVKAENFGLLLHLGNWIHDNKDELDLEFASRAMHMHINFEHCMESDRILPELKKAGYKGCWSVECHKAHNEYTHVALQLAKVKHTLSFMSYNGAWEIAPPSYLEKSAYEK